MSSCHASCPHPSSCSPWRWCSECTTANVYVNSSTNLFFPAHGDGGGVSKQGLTSLAIIVEDTCTAAESMSVLAGGGGGSTLIADWMGQTQAALSVQGNLSQAHIVATIPMEDEVSGAHAVATVDLAWAATGPAVGTPSRIHLRYPYAVVVNSNSNDVQRDAIASGMVLIGGVNMTPEPTDGLLSVTRFHCRQIGFAQMGSDWDMCY